MDRLRNALVAGGSGLVGGALVKTLAAVPEYGAIHLLTRRPLELPWSGVVEHRVDFDHLGDFSPGIDVDHVFCALGTTMKQAGSRQAFRRVDYDYVLAVGELARRLGAEKLLVVSSLGADPQARSFYLQVKGEAEEALAALGLPALVIFRPSLLAGERREFRLGERLGLAATRLLAPLLVGPLARYRSTPARRVASAMLRAALAPASGVTVVSAEEIAADGD